MSLNLHFCEEYKVRHSQTTVCDGNECNAINRLFEWLNNRAEHRHILSGNDQDFAFSDYLEWDKEGVREALSILRDMDRANETWRDIPTYSPMPTNHTESSGDWSMDKWQKDELVYAEKVHKITPKRMADFLQDALDNCEESIDYIVFLWI